MTGTAVTGRIRDVTTLALPDGSTMVVACDSVGGIGPKPGDTVAADPYTVGYFAARTPVLEVLAAGAVPRLVVNNLCFETGPVADAMIAAMSDLARELGLDAGAVTGSTEDNVTTTSTAVGVTVVGIAEAGRLRGGSSRAGDIVVCLGLPRSAPAHTLTPADRAMPTVAEVVRVLHMPGVREVLPVGSRGVAAEFAALAATAGLRHQIDDRHSGQDSGFDVHASGGPASCVLVSLSSGALVGLRAIRADLPVTVIGKLSSSPPT
ncbi:AIR synthase related protein, N-terminal domain [Nakamurella panacisegetis]|uniref:AIR synthase related protein, N-terminal domain n=1 Tax=Nakamurella panacisegetis TaxID=1090615 RepID=A0A1H0PDJ2_9ACTN|nr:AIR synthase related protein [Nakamurella panacisegetis]SDP02820.1 AIR synthase related protein, N-terminal domain [Nakamurella panacisegetis]